MSDLKDFLENIRKFSSRIGEVAMKHVSTISFVSDMYLSYIISLTVIIVSWEFLEILNKFLHILTFQTYLDEINVL